MIFEQFLTINFLYNCKILNCKIMHKTPDDQLPDQVLKYLTF